MKRIKQCLVALVVSREILGWVFEANTRLVQQDTEPDRFSSETPTSQYVALEIRNSVEIRHDPLRLSNAEL